MMRFAAVGGALMIAAACAGAQPTVVGNAVPGGTPSAQAALAPLVAPRASELLANGVQTIVARTGKQRRDIQVKTRNGPIYFGWPKDVTPVSFEIDIRSTSDIVVRADDYNEANKARYAAALDAILPQASSQARHLKNRVDRPK